jgi:hypothetical protein
MPLNVDRTSIGLHQATLHEHALERTDRAAKAAATAQTASTATADVNLDVRIATGAHEELSQVDQAEKLVQLLRADAISALRGIHTGIDSARAAALLAD